MRKKQYSPSDTLLFSPLLYCGNPLIEEVQEKVNKKIQDYGSYHFSTHQSQALNIFFDLAQEFEGIEKIHILPVIILRMFFQLEAELYTKNPQGALTLRTPHIKELPDLTGQHDVTLRHEKNYWILPLYGKQAHDPNQSSSSRKKEAIGALLVLENTIPQAIDPLFLEKFANRIGYSLHAKFLAEHNARHIEFMNKLTHDIGHNIVTPSIRFKLMLVDLEKQITSLEEITQKLPPDHEEKAGLLELQSQMALQYKRIMAQFINSTLFLESLLRQSHFSLGRYALQKVPLDVYQKIVFPQFERYRLLLEEKNISLPARPQAATVPCMVEADLGLVSQALANFFANALKYAAPDGAMAKATVSCGLTLIPNAFSQGNDGIKVYVTSSGPMLSYQESRHVFDDSYRAPNAAAQNGTGHGLFFVHEVITAHGGLCGYERLPEGNSFYFILPAMPGTQTL